MSASPSREHFPDVPAVRAYKARFDPVWGPRHLAAPSGLALPSVLHDVAAFVARGRRS